MKDLKLTLRYVTGNGGWVEVSTSVKLGFEFSGLVQPDWKLEWAKVTEYGDDELRGTFTIGEF